MSAETKVDVDAVMGDMERIARLFAHNTDADPAAVHQARVAMAEFVEAAKGLERKLWEVASRYNDRSCDYDVCSETRRFHAALSRIGAVQ